MSIHSLFHEDQEEKKSENCDDKQEDEFLIYHEIPLNQVKEYLVRSKAYQKPKKYTPLKLKSRKRYYEPGVVAKVDNNTTDTDLCRLLRHGIRTLLVQTAFASHDELEQIMLKINTAIDNYMMEVPYNTPIGLAVEIKGEMVRTGRLRNYKRQEIEVGKLLVLTINEDYRFLSVKEVIFVYNLWKYMSYLKIGDVIFMNHNQIQLRIVKIINKNITLCIEEGEYIESYMDVVLPYCLTTNFEPSNDDFEDIDFAMRNNAHFLVVPYIKSFCWLKMYKKYLETCFKPFDIAGYIPEKCFDTNSCELVEIMKLCDVIWIPNFFERKRKSSHFEVPDKTRRIINVAKRLLKPIVVGIPIRTRKDFGRLENHEMLKEIDSMLIEKSPVTRTFPIIAKRLQPLPKIYCTGEANPIYRTAHKQYQDQGLVNCINYALQTIPCQGIVTTTTLSDRSMIHLSAADIYCPVVAVVPNETFAKRLNIRRNIKTVVFSCKLDKNTGQVSIEHGLSYGRDMKIFWEGDFVISFYDTIFHGCMLPKFSALHVPKEKILVTQKRLN